MAEETDDRLIERCQKGDRRAFETLVERYQKPLYNGALKLVRNAEDAEDIVQTAFVKAFSSLDSYDNRYKFFSWIYRIMTNEALNHLDRRGRYTQLNPATPSNSKTPDAEYQQRELSTAVQEAMMDLSIDSRVVIVLRHYAELTYREMSFVLEVPLKTVKSRLFSARRRLGELLVQRGVELYER